ncbi:hypothetical protein B0H11DRAFT_2391889 [Mycena galericulata]|nr:hypothetical protein B0H11DRAFT_2391889 [Mycena galericulata]
MLPSTVSRKDVTSVESCAEDDAPRPGPRPRRRWALHLPAARRDARATSDCSVQRPAPSGPTTLPLLAILTPPPLRRRRPTSITLRLPDRSYGANEPGNARASTPIARLKLLLLASFLVLHVLNLVLPPSPALLPAQTTPFDRTLLAFRGTRAGAYGSLSGLVPHYTGGIHGGGIPRSESASPRIKRHPYFSMKDWSHVYYKRYIPPYIPPIDPSNASDTPNFDNMFLDICLRLRSRPHPHARPHPRTISKSAPPPRAPPRSAPFVREATTELLAVCLEIGAERERSAHTHNTAPPAYLPKILANAQAGLKLAAPEAVHGALLALRERGVSSRSSRAARWDPVVRSMVVALVPALASYNAPTLTMLLHDHLHLLFAAAPRLHFSVSFRTRTHLSLTLRILHSFAAYGRPIRTLAPPRSAFCPVHRARFVRLHGSGPEDRCYDAPADPLAPTHLPEFPSACLPLPVLLVVQSLFHWLLLRVRLHRWPRRHVHLLEHVLGASPEPASSFTCTSTLAAKLQPHQPHQNNGRVSAQQVPPQARAPVAGAAPARAPAPTQPGYKLNPTVCYGGAAAPATGGPDLSAAALASASPLEQKQMLGLHEDGQLTA